MANVTTCPKCGKCYELGGAACMRVESGENMGPRTQVRAADRMGTVLLVLFPYAVGSIME